jgi:hypothetical protein
MPVDPPEAKRLVPRLRPVDRGFPAAFLPEADEQFRRGLLICFEPAAKVGVGGEEGRLRSYEIAPLIAKALNRASCGCVPF